MNEAVCNLKWRGYFYLCPGFTHFHPWIRSHFHTSRQPGHVSKWVLPLAQLLMYSRWYDTVAQYLENKTCVFFVCMAFSPLNVVSPQLLLYATIQMVHSQSTLVWLILSYRYQYGPSAEETHYTVYPLSVCVCMCVYVCARCLFCLFEISPH